MSATLATSALSAGPALTKPNATATAPFPARVLARARRWLAGFDWTDWAVLGIALVGLVLRLYGLNWDDNNHLHPDERQIVFKAMCLTLPDQSRGASCDPAYTGPGWFFSPDSPLNTHFYAYGLFPQYLLAIVAHALAWLNTHLGGHLAPSNGGAWDDYDHFALVGRAISAVFDTASIVLSAVIARLLVGRWARIGRWAAVLTAALVAVTPLEVQLAHFYAVDTILLFFVLLTLLLCLLLARAASIDDEEKSSARLLRLSVLAGVAFGLAMATKVSALPLLAPVGVTLLLVWRRRNLWAALLVAMGLAATAILAFVITSPYALIDWSNANGTGFLAQVSEQTQLSQGKLDYPYVRQFADTMPFVYQLQQTLLYDMDVPLALAAFAGFAWAVSRIWRKWDGEWTVLVAWIAVYFAVVGSAYTKFSRYMLPIFPPLVICGVGALAALAAWRAHVERGQSATAGSLARGGWYDGLRARWAVFSVRVLPPGRWRVGVAGLALVVLLVSAFLTLALDNIYSTPNTRVQASEWIYDNIKPGATLTYEVWDDALPILVPPARTDASGQGYTSDGHPINAGQYSEIGLDLYADDTPDKAQTLAQSLSTADVVIISSQRLVKSIPKLPDRYPMTTRYYQLLFDGKLGFTLAAHFENHPNLLGITEDDTGADESFSVYDHPPVWIFTKQGAGLTQDQIQTLLTQGLTLPAASTRSGDQKSLLLSPQDAAADNQSQPLGVQFPATSLPNRVPLFWWLLIVELLGVIGFPLAFFVFPGLRDRGWGLSKALTLLLLAYLTWLPASLRVVEFSVQSVVGALVVLAAVSALVAWRRWAELRNFVRARWRLLVVCEAAFLVAFLFFTWIRALDPDLWHIYRGGEKPMELSFLNAILRSRTMPPYDPWYSGGYINYYYYGQYLIAVLIKLTGIAPTTAFNLAIPLVFGLAFTAAFSIVAGLTGRWWAGLLGGLAFVVVGNLDGALQLLDQIKASLAHLAPVAFDYWRSSRVIPFTINEFPYWSFLYADLHAHVLDLPVVGLAIAACASLLNMRRRGPVRWRAGVPTLAAASLALGAAWCINTWDLPTYAGLLVVCAALWVALPVGGGWREALASLRDWRTLRGLIVALALTLAGSYALYEPFHAQFQNFTSGIGTVTTPTDPGQFITLFGLWLFLVASFYMVEIYDHWRFALSLRGYEATGEENGEVGAAFGLPDTFRLLLIFAIGLVLLALAYILAVKILLLLLIAVGVWLLLVTRPPTAKLLTYLLVLLGLCVAFGVELIYVRDFLDNSDWERMNTVFKFYYQVWTLLAIGGAFILAHLLPRLFTTPSYTLPSPLEQGAEGPEPGTAPEGTSADNSLPLPSPLGKGAGGLGQLALRLPATIVPGALRGVWVTILLVLVLGSSVFLVEGTSVRVQDPAVWAQVQPPPGGVQPQGLSLDGMAYMRGWYPGDYAAITWLNEHVGGDPTIIEASNGPYAWYSRVAIYTGLPSVLGWSAHESQQRYGDAVYTRQNDVQNFYATVDTQQATDILRKYDVKYVYLGDLERNCYMTDASNACVPMPPDALTKFSTLVQAKVLKVVYDAQGVTIYQVVG